MADLQKKYDTEPQKPPGSPEVPPNPGQGTQLEDAPAPGDDGLVPEAIKPKDGKKIGGWKVAEYWRKQHKEVSAQLADAHSRIIPEADAKKLQEELKLTKGQAERLEQIVKFKDYQQSSEFQEKYWKPYQSAWTRALSELSEIPVTDSSGQARQMKAEDLMNIVNMPLAQARQVAEAAFGPFAGDVMTHRKEIRTLFDQQAAALKEAEKNGVEHSKKMQDQFKEAMTKLTTHVNETYKAANEAIASDPKYGPLLKAEDTDAEAKGLLEKGFAFADKALAESPMNPNLSPEQRADIIRRHAALRNRAAAFPRLMRDRSQHLAKIAELEKELQQYKGSTPPTGGEPRGTASPSGAPMSARERLMADLQKLAK